VGNDCAVPGLTRITDIKLNARVSLRHCAIAISFADDAAPLYGNLEGRLDRGGDVGDHCLRALAS
jgi:hypothetical protein